MDFGLIVLAIHKDIKEAQGGIVAKNLGQVAFLVVNVLSVFCAYLVDLVEGVNELGSGHTKVPDDFWSAFLGVLQLFNDEVHNFLNVLFNLV